MEESYLSFYSGLHLVLVAANTSEAAAAVAFVSHFGLLISLFAIYSSDTFNATQSQT